jgi:hypothetical protein
MVDMPTRKNALKVNLMDYLENTVAKRLEQGMVEKDKLLGEMARDKEDKGEEREGFSPDEANELEELLKAIMGNKA